MKNTFGNSVSVTLFGESHGAGVGAVIDGLSPGIPVDEEYIKLRLSQRRPSGNISTTRREPDEFQIHSGIFNGYTTGTPLCIFIPNTCQHSGDYSELKSPLVPVTPTTPQSVNTTDFRTIAAADISAAG